MSWPHQRPRVVPVSRPSVFVAEHAPVDRLAALGGLSVNLDEVKYQIYEQLLRDLDLGRLQSMQGVELRHAIDEAAATMLQAREIPLNRVDRQRLIREIGDEILGFGPLEPLLADPTVSEIMVNGTRA